MSRVAYNVALKGAVSTVLAAVRPGQRVALAAIEASLPVDIAPPGRTTLAKIVTGLGWVKQEGPGGASYAAPAQRCGCAECCDLDRSHPGEGWQMPLPVAGAAGEARS